VKLKDFKDATKLIEVAMINWHAETKDQAEKEIEEFEAKHAKLSEEGQE
jgi:hypothetical protein